MPFVPKEDRVVEPYEDAVKRLKGANNVVKRPIPRLSEGFGKRHKGREKKFTPVRMRNAVNRYFAQCETRDEMPTIKGLMIYLKMHKDMFYTYLQYPEFTEIMEHTRLIIAHWAETAVFNETGRTEGKIAYMKNVHAWADKVETKNETTNVNLQMTAEQAREKIAQLAPKLLELLGQSTVIEQVAPKEIEAVVVEPEKSRADRLRRV